MICVCQVKQLLIYYNYYYNTNCLFFLFFSFKHYNCFVYPCSSCTCMSVCPFLSTAGEEVYHLDCERAKVSPANKPPPNTMAQEQITRVRPQSDNSARNSKSLLVNLLEYTATVYTVVNIGSTIILFLYHDYIVTL